MQTACKRHANGMVSFTVEGGSNQGVFFASDTGSFASQIFGDYTTFTGLINPDGNNTFSLYASYLGDPVEGTVSAFSRGVTSPVAFNDITVEFTAVGHTPPPNIRSCISEINTATNGVSVVGINAEISNFDNYYLTKSFRIASTTNLTTGVWVTNSTPPASPARSQPSPSQTATPALSSSSSSTDDIYFCEDPNCA